MLKNFNMCAFLSIYSNSLQVFSSFCDVTVSTVATMLSFNSSRKVTGVLQIMFLTYPHRKNSSGITSGKRGGLGIGPKYANFFLL
jgi:hypothetical protein